MLSESYRSKHGKGKRDDFENRDAQIAEGDVVLDRDGPFVFHNVLEAVVGRVAQLDIGMGDDRTVCVSDCP